MVTQSTPFVQCILPGIADVRGKEGTAPSRQLLWPARAKYLLYPKASRRSATASKHVQERPCSQFMMLKLDLAATRRQRFATARVEVAATVASRQVHCDLHLPQCPLHQLRFPDGRIQKMPPRKSRRSMVGVDREKLPVFDPNDFEKYRGRLSSLNHI